MLDISSLLSEEERDIQATVRDFLADRARPHIGEWFENAHFPRELVPELGKLGLLGMHLEGYGCAGTSAVSYGLACLELEAVDSGLRSFVSVQGSLSMYSIRRWGSEEQKQEWLPRLAAGEAIGCFGLTEPDFGSNPSGHAHAAPSATASDWVLNGIEDVDHQRRDRRRRHGVGADRGGHPRVPRAPRDVRLHHAATSSSKMSLRASVTSELSSTTSGCPTSAQLPEARGLADRCRA